MRNDNVSWKIKVKINRSWWYAVCGVVYKDVGIAYGRRANIMAAEIKSKDLSVFIAKLLASYPDIVQVSVVRCR